MSAFVVNYNVINELLYSVWGKSMPEADGGHKMFPHQNGNAYLTELGRILLRENIRSVNARYSIDYNTADERHINSFIYQPRNYVSSIQTLKHCDCFDYQACENNDYFESHAAKIVQSIRKNAITSLPGYDEAKWG